MSSVQLFLGHPIACAIVLVAAYLSTWPFTETGVLDDWSFVRTALDLLKTGELRYNGWAAPMIGAQAYLGAISASMFGPSLTAVRLTVLPLAVLACLVLRALLRHGGATPAGANLGALAFGLSPVVIPLATSFMTDVPALLGSLACALALVNAGRSANTRTALAWLAAATIAGALGGSVRQTAWLAPLAMLPSFAWLERRRPGIAFAALGLAAMTGIMAAEANRWLGAQLYVAEVRGLGDSVVPVLQGFPFSLRKLVPLALTTVGLVLPLMLARTVGAVFGGVGSRRIVVAAVLAAVAATLLLPWSGPAPWLDNLLCRTGIVGGGTTVLGSSPATMSPLVQSVLAIVTYASIPLVLVTIARPVNGGESGRMVLWLLGSFAAAYIVVLGIYTSRALAFDRYVLPVLPLVILLLSRKRPEHSRLAMSVGAVLVALWGMYGVAITHDMFATLRARREAVDRLVAQDVPRTSITGGVEIDGLTQIDAQGFIANPMVKNPPEVRAAFRRRSDLPIRHWFLNNTPAIKPRFWISLSPIEGFREAALPPVEYERWLPPRRHCIHVIETF